MKEENIMEMFQLSYTLPDQPNHWLYERVVAKNEEDARKRVSGAKYLIAYRIPKFKEFRRYISE